MDDGYIELTAKQKIRRNWANDLIQTLNYYIREECYASEELNNDFKEYLSEHLETFKEIEDLH